MTHQPDDTGPLNGPRPMSTAVRELVDKAIGDAMQEAGGGFVTGYVAFVTFIDPDGDPCWSMAVPAGQSCFGTLGLLRGATIATETQTARWFE